MTVPPITAASVAAPQQQSSLWHRVLNLAKQSILGRPTGHQQQHQHGTGDATLLGTANQFKGTLGSPRCPATPSQSQLTWPDGTNKSGHHAGGPPRCKSASSQQPAKPPPQAVPDGSSGLVCTSSDNVLTDSSSDSAEGGDGFQVALGFFSTQGVRTSNEDRTFHQTFPMYRSSCFGVLDGHGGHECAHHLQETIPQLMDECMFQLRRASCDHTRHSAMTKLILDLEAQLFNMWKNGDWMGDTERDPGSTALVATIVKDLMVVANVGDSRLIVAHDVMDEQGSHATKVLHATEDHCCRTNAKERERVLGQGGFLTDDFCLGKEVPEEPLPESWGGSSLVSVTSTEGGLASAGGFCPAGAVLTRRRESGRYVAPVIEVSRSIGDFRTKEELGEKVLICKPEVQTFRLTKNALFAVAFTDGISSCMSNEEICDKVAHLLNDQRKPNDPQYAAEELTRWAVDVMKSSDNCSAVVAVFKSRPPPIPPQQQRPRRFYNSSKNTSFASELNNLGASNSGPVSTALAVASSLGRHSGPASAALAASNLNGGSGPIPAALMVPPVVAQQ